jgi:hypothetical protein
MAPVASDRPPPGKLTPPPGEGARLDVFERETLHALNKSLRCVLTLGNEGNRLLGKLAEVLSISHETALEMRELAQVAITEQQLTREALRNLTDEIALWCAERRKDGAGGAAKPAERSDRSETTAVRARPVRKVAG